MQSTYDEFLKTFVANLKSVAEFEGEEDQTLSVITGALESANLKPLLNELDNLKRQTSDTPVVANSTEVPRKASSGVRTKKTSNVKNTEDGESKPSKPKRVTGYNVFVAEQVKEKKNSMSEAAAAWKTMDTEARAPYMQKAANQNSS